MVNRISVLAAVGVVAALTLTGCSSAATTEPTVSASATASTEESQSPTTAEESSAPTATEEVGDPVEEEVMDGPVTLPVGSVIELDGWSITVDTVVRNQQEVLDQLGGELSPVEEGDEVVSIAYTATRTADTPGHIEEPQVDITDSNWNGSATVVQDLPYDDVEGGSVAPGASFNARTFQALNTSILEGGDLQANVWIAAEGSSGLSMSVETTV